MMLSSALSTQDFGKSAETAMLEEFASKYNISVKKKKASLSQQIEDSL